VIWIFAVFGTERNPNVCKGLTGIEITKVSRQVDILGRMTAGRAGGTRRTTITILLFPQPSKGIDPWVTDYIGPHAQTRHGPCRPIISHGPCRMIGAPAATFSPIPRQPDQRLLLESEDIIAIQQNRDLIIWAWSSHVPAMIQNGVQKQVMLHRTMLIHGKRRFNEFLFPCQPWRGSPFF
jgi:hypothetical protein